VTRKGWTFYPKRYKEFKEKLGTMMREAVQGVAPLAASLTVRIALACQSPKHSKLPFPKPDVDNYAKAVMDAANKTIWVDDTQVQSLTVTKEWSQAGKIRMEVEW
jgi:Holliday junction resolvase RusA-like endonuclease